MLHVLTGSRAQSKPIPRLEDQVRDVRRLKHYSLRTERTYWDWIERFIRFHGKRHSRDMAEPEVTEFLNHLAREGKVAASTQNQQAKGRLRCHSRRSENGKKGNRWR